MVKFSNSALLSRLKLIYTDYFFVHAASRASGPPALMPWAPSTPGWPGHNRGEPLMILDYITVGIPQADPAELLACPQIKLHYSYFSDPRVTSTT
jgi:hypothetical protein